MILIDDLAQFSEFIKEDRRNHIKYVIILERFYAISQVDMLASDEYKDLPCKDLVITQTLLKSLPAPRQDLSFVTPKLIRKKPVIMFERPDMDGIYFRFDGRHRILGAAKLGHTAVRAKWVPREIWGKYIIGSKPEDPSQEPTPLSWARSPGAPLQGECQHWEPNFKMKGDEYCQATYPEKPIVESARQLSPNKTKKVEQPKVDLFARNAGIVRFM